MLYLQKGRGKCKHDKRYVRYRKDSKLPYMEKEAMFKMRNTSNAINGRLDTAEEKVSKLEDID